MISLKKVLSEIKPTKEEEEKLRQASEEFIIRLNSSLKDAKAIVSGSAAKHTWLKNKYDIDIFVIFNYRKYSGKSDSLSDILGKSISSKFRKSERLHGSRDYFRVKFNGFEFEIIPVLDIKNSSQAKNITDVSPLHAKWVSRHTKLADDIRLLKQFCKSSGVYGAESYIRGFSGYICEILVIKYSSFLSTIRSASKWDEKEKTILDVEKHYKGKNPLAYLNESKTISPIIIIDPVQKERNAAAAISEEKYKLFISQCKKFLKNPSEKFFAIKQFSTDEVIKSAEKNPVILFTINPLDGKIDVIGSKLLKAYEHISQKFAEQDFKIKKKGWSWNKNEDAIFYFIFDSKPLSKIKIHTGPEIRLNEHAEKFKKLHRQTFIKGNRIYAKIPRRFTKPEQLAKELLNDQYIKERTKKISLSRHAN